MHACYPFMEMLVIRDTTTPSSSYYKPLKIDYYLCLAINAPRKEIIEVYLFSSFLSWKYTFVIFKLFIVAY